MEAIDYPARRELDKALVRQLATCRWVEEHQNLLIGEPTLADSICDRLVHNAHRLVLKGPSRRKEGKLDD